jgi:hypothetical protein
MSWTTNKSAKNVITSETSICYVRARSRIGLWTLTMHAVRWNQKIDGILVQLHLKANDFAGFILKNGHKQETLGSLIATVFSDLLEHSKATGKSLA